MRSISKQTRRGAHYSPLRRRYEIAQAWLYGNGLAAAASYALGLQRAPRARPVQMGFSPELKRPMRVAFASDFHAGPCTDPRVLAAAVDAISRFEPHLILLGGDFVSHHHDHIDTLVPLLARLRAPCGIYAVPGNHDLWTDDRAIAAALESAGVRVLVNDNVPLPAPFDRIWVCGLDDPGTGSPDAARALHGAAGARLLLMHSPIGLKHVAPDAFDLALCGHTHGGQVALPGGRPIVLPHGRHNRDYPHGLYDLGGERNARILVSKGVGCSDIPIRLFADGEIHRITLFPPG